MSKSIDYENLAKGRTIDDTKAVLNYMILALHQIKSKQQPNFDSMKFLDQVTLNILNELSLNVTELVYEFFFLG